MQDCMYSSFVCEFFCLSCSIVLTFDVTLGFSQNSVGSSTICMSLSDFSDRYSLLYNVVGM